MKTNIVQTKHIASILYCCTTDVLIIIIIQSAGEWKTTAKRRSDATNGAGWDGWEKKKKNYKISNTINNAETANDRADALILAVTLETATAAARPRFTTAPLAAALQVRWPAAAAALHFVGYPPPGPFLL